MNSAQVNSYVSPWQQSSKQVSWEIEVHFNQFNRSHLWVMTGRFQSKIVCLCVFQGSLIAAIVIGRFRSILFVSGFQHSLAVAIIMIDNSEKCNY